MKAVIHVQAVPRQHGFRGGKRALHLVVHHPFVRQGIVRFRRLQGPAFLLENGSGNARKKYGVQIHVHKIVEILKVGAGHRITGLVRVGGRSGASLSAVPQKVP